MWLTHFKQECFDSDDLGPKWFEQTWLQRRFVVIFRLSVPLECDFQVPKTIFSGKLGTRELGDIPGELGDIAGELGDIPVRVRSVNAFKVTLTSMSCS